MFGIKKQTSSQPQYKATQSFLYLQEVRDSTLILDDGTMRAILAVSTTNFDLKNEDEQTGLVLSYQRFLNSLDFPVQILIQSRRMQIDGYLAKLKVMAEKQTNELLRIQTTEYIEFVSRLVETANIMSKQFYIVIPANEMLTTPKVGMFSRLFGHGAAEQAKGRLANFEKLKSSLDQQVASTEANVGSMGLKAVRLSTEQIIELLYNSYNFESGPPLDASKLGETQVIT